MSNVNVPRTVNNSLHRAPTLSFDAAVARGIEIAEQALAALPNDKNIRAEQVAGNPFLEHAFCVGKNAIGAVAFKALGGVPKQKLQSELDRCVALYGAGALTDTVGEEVLAQTGGWR